VGHLTRNIKITRTVDANDWGCRVLVYNFLDGSINRRGFVNLYGVEIPNCGQYDTTMAALDFNQLQTPGTQSYVKGCAIHSGQGMAINMFSSINVTIDNNVLAIQKKQMVRVSRPKCGPSTTT
jgi:hypothetical protein